MSSLCFPTDFFCDILCRPRLTSIQDKQPSGICHLKSIIKYRTAKKKEIICLTVVLRLIGSLWQRLSSRLQSATCMKGAHVLHIDMSRNLYGLEKISHNPGAIRTYTESVKILPKILFHFPCLTQNPYQFSCKLQQHIFLDLNFLKSRITELGSILD